MLISKNRFKLLKIFYSHPEKDYYMQEISGLLGKKAGVYQRALNDLEKEGILLSEYKANARFFKINKDCAIYNELKGIIYKSNPRKEN